MGYWGVVMQDPACELPRIPIPRTPVNKGRELLRVHRRFIACRYSASHAAWLKRRSNEMTDLKPNKERNEPSNRTSSGVFALVALAGGAAYLLLGVLLALLLDWYINPGDSSEK
jgi:hypothetical protein